MNKVYYDVDLSYDDILIVERHNGKMKGNIKAAYLDTLYIEVLKKYYALLGVKQANTLSISDEEYICDVLSKNQDKDEAVYISHLQNPVDLIQVGINMICAVMPFYREFES